MNYFLIIHSSQLLYSTLYHGGQDLISTELVNEGLGLLTLLLYLDGLLVMIKCVFCLSLLVRVIVSLVVGEFLVLKEDGLLHNMIKELSIMTNHNYSDTTVAQVVIQPHNTIKIKMVSGLIQEKYIRFNEEGTGDVTSHPPSSR